MEVDINISLSDVLREVIAFLECLRDAQLPSTLESLREKLLARSKKSLSVATTTTRSSSSEPYLDMKAASKSVSLKVDPKSEIDLEEYVGMENSPQQTHQDYYEIFEHDGQTVAPNDVTVNATPRESPERNNDRDENQTLIRIYKNLSAAQSRSKCHKCGPLCKKESKKLFQSEIRACWIALMGTHLLVYRNERNARPYAIYPIRGYMARPAPNLIPRDRRRSESAFEMYCPGNETLQFVARTRKEMDQWIAKIGEVGRVDEENAETKVREKTASETPTNPRRKNDDERHRRVAKKSIAVVVDKPTTETTESRDNKSETRRKNTVGRSPPPLPARIPRRFPPSTLSSKDTVSSDEAPVADKDEEDAIYYRIEDLNIPYQNLPPTRKPRANNNVKKHKAVGYDDDVSEVTNQGPPLKGERAADPILPEETYDDIATLLRIDATASTAEEEENRNSDRPIADREEAFYDDVENLIPNGRPTKENRQKDQTDASSKLHAKKSFLDRVWNRKESPGKSDKKLGGKVSSSPPPSSVAEETTPTYDDISDLKNSNKESLANDSDEELPEYKYPPPPRPISVQLPFVNNPDDRVEDIYDDVSACREQYNKNRQESCARAKEAEKKSDATESGANDDLSREETQHYQSPRSDPCVRDAPRIEQDEEDMYDDVALWANFTARKRDSGDGKSTIDGSDKKSRNPLAERTASTARDGDEREEIEENNSIGENNNGSARRNTFRRLISKMENSLARVSARGPPAFPMNKPSTASNDS